MPVGPSYFAMRNKIINGAMEIDQRNAGAAVTPSSPTTTYIVDRFGIYVNQSSKLTAQQNAGGATPPSGFSKYLGITSSSSYSSLAADVFVLYQAIEGLNTIDFQYGKSSAKTATLSFWVRSSLTGTHSGAITNSGNARSYVFTYTISVANTWEYKTISIPGDQTGTWLTTNGYGIGVKFDLGSGSNTRGAAGSWSAGELNGATGSVSLVGTNGATWYVTGIQFEIGAVATPFEWRLYGTELQLAQRYHQKLTKPKATGVFTSATSIGRIGMPLLVEMRASPTFSSFGALDWYDGSTVGTITTIGTAYTTPQGFDFDCNTATGSSATLRVCLLYVGNNVGGINLTSEF
jgi:hypothetical protein